MSAAGYFFSALGYVIAIVIVAGVTYDLYATHQTPELQTISEWIYHAARREPLLWGALLTLVLFGTALLLLTQFLFGWGVDLR